MPAGPRTHRLVFVGIVAALSLFAGGAAVVQQRTTASCAAMQQRVQALESAWQRRDHRREPLWGAGTDGPAYAGYAAALDLAKRLQGDQAALVATLPHRDDDRVAGKEALRDRWRPAIDLLREAAHRTDTRPDAVTRNATGSCVVNLLDARWLVNMTVFEARALRLAGQARAAVERTLDAATLGADLVRSDELVNQMIGAALVAIAADEAWPDAALRQLDAGALDLLGTGLERLDRGLPVMVNLDGELRFLARTLRGSPATSVRELDTGSWRYGFSTQWMFADAFLSLAAAYERIAGERRLSWPQREAWLRLELEAVAGSGNPITATAVPNLSSAEATLRQIVASVRMLRMAVDVHRGIDATPLQDPLGAGPFAVVREAGAVTFRSAGTRGGRIIERCARR